MIEGRIKKIFILLLFIFIAIFLFNYYQEQKRLNIYNWYGMIDQDILDQFQQETGIHINYDYYDNNEIVETKLLTGQSGYDIVFPSVSPYVNRLIQSKALEKIDLSQLSNFHFVDSRIQEKIRHIDEIRDFFVPYFYGALGIAYNEDKIKEILRKNNLDLSVFGNYDIFFNPRINELFKTCGVTLLEESTDVYPILERYLTRKGQREFSLEEIQHNLLQIRPFIRHFSSTRFVNELASGETCLAQAWSGDAHLIKDYSGQKTNVGKIIFVIPEGSTLWIDGIVIPKNAPHYRNAHKFIDFLFREDIAALISERKMIAIAHKAIKKRINSEISNDETIYFNDEVLKTLSLDPIYPLSYEKQRTRYWNEFRVWKAYL